MDIKFTIFMSLGVLILGILAIILYDLQLCTS